MSSITKATPEDNVIYLTEETDDSETAIGTMTTLTTTTNPSGVPTTTVSTVTISITSTED
jgi:hypothetical protein